MDRKQHANAILEYRLYFESCGVKEITYPHDKIVQKLEHKIGHCFGMLDKMTEFLDEGRIGKVNRWLGFIQGVLWAEAGKTLDELKETNRP